MSNVAISVPMPTLQSISRPDFDIAVPPEAQGGNWKVQNAWQNLGTSAANKDIDANSILGGKVEVRVPFDSTTVPGIRGNLRFVVTRWNPDAVMFE